MVEICLGRVHHTDVVYCNKTNLTFDRPTLFQPCTSNLLVKEQPHSHVDEGFISDNCLFRVTKYDDQPALSVQDREFVDIMNKEMVKDPSGHWVAPLPFQYTRPRLPNNCQYALRRAVGLRTSLLKDPKKLQHFVTYMDQIIGRGHA